MIITPYLPKDAEVAARTWMRDKKQPAFIIAIDHTASTLACPNCNDLGAIYLKLCKSGPYQRPISEKIAYVWYEGDSNFGKGWYVLDNTLAFACPECKGIARQPGKPITPERMAELRANEGQLIKKLNDKGGQRGRIRADRQPVRVSGV